MRLQADVERALKAAASSTDRILYLAAMLSTELTRPEGSVIVVGGSAIEVYTLGAYTSGDIDLVVPRKFAAGILESWGFVTEGRTWRHKAWKLDVDLVGGTYHGSSERLREIATPYGRVRLASSEDLLVNRLIEAKHWQGRKQEAFEQAVLLAKECGGQFDNDYLDYRAKKEDIIDILEDLREFIRP
jgi:hypothetical protein